MIIGCTPEMVFELWRESWMKDHKTMQNILDNSNWQSYLRNNDRQYKGIDDWLTTLSPSKLNGIYIKILKIHKKYAIS